MAAADSARTVGVTDAVFDTLTVRHRRYVAAMSTRRPDELGHSDLGAHSQHTFRLYGGEEVWVADIRGRDNAPDPDVTIKFKNVQLSGALSTLQSFADVMSALLVETLVRRDEIETNETATIPKRVPTIGPRGRVTQRDRPGDPT